MNVRIEPPKERGAGVLFLRILLGASVLLIAGIAVFVFLDLTRPAPPPPLELKTFYGDVAVRSEERNVWARASRGAALSVNDILQTGPGAGAELALKDDIHLRLRENTEVKLLVADFLDRKPVYRLQLNRGSILGALRDQFKDAGFKLVFPGRANRVESGRASMEVSVPRLFVDIERGSFLAEYEPKTQHIWFGMLKGAASAREKGWGRAEPVHSLQKIELGTDTAQKLAAGSVSRKDWDELKEAYTLLQKKAPEAAVQLDLSKKCGNLFQFVIDQGTFYTPEMGHAYREFMEDGNTGEVYLETEYDVFPRGSFVGIYIKTRDLDISKYQALKFDVRLKPGEEGPQSVKLELKSKGNVLRGLAVKPFKKQWQTLEFPLNFNDPKLIHELTFVIAHDRTGDEKRGYFQMKNFELVPKS